MAIFEYDADGQTEEEDEDCIRRFTELGFALFHDYFGTSEQQGIENHLALCKKLQEEEMFSDEDIRVFTYLRFVAPLNTSYQELLDEYDRQPDMFLTLVDKTMLNDLMFVGPKRLFAPIKHVGMQLYVTALKIASSLDKYDFERKEDFNWQGSNLPILRTSNDLFEAKREVSEIALKLVKTYKKKLKRDKEALRKAQEELVVNRKKYSLTHDELAGIRVETALIDIDLADDRIQSSKEKIESIKRYFYIKNLPTVELDEPLTKKQQNAKLAKKLARLEESEEEEVEEEIEELSIPCELPPAKPSSATIEQILNSKKF